MPKELSRRGVFGALIGASATTAASAALVVTPTSEYPYLDEVTINGKMWRLRWTGWKRHSATHWCIGQHIAICESSPLIVYSSFPGASDIYYKRNMFTFDISIKPHQEKFITDDFLLGEPKALDDARVDAYLRLLEHLKFA